MFKKLQNNKKFILICPVLCIRNSISGIVYFFKTIFSTVSLQSFIYIPDVCTLQPAVGNSAMYGHALLV